MDVLSNKNESDEDFDSDFGSMFDEQVSEYKQETTNISSDEVRKYWISEDLAENLYNLLNCVHRIFSHHHITYWLCGGSLLGACRHQGLIPWDDDLDICCLVEQREDILKLKQLFAKNGYVVDFDESSNRSTKFSLQIYKEGSFYYVDDGEKVPYPFLDIFFMTSDCPEIESQDDSIMHFSSAMHRVLYKNHYFKLKELFPLKSCVFGPLNEICIPIDPVSHLNRAYGELWSEQGQIHIYDHKSKQYTGGPLKVFSVKKFPAETLTRSDFALQNVTLF